MKKKFVLQNGQPVFIEECSLLPDDCIHEQIYKRMESKVLIDYVTEQLNNDQNRLEEKTAEREWRLRDFKKMSMLATGASVIVPVFFGLISGMHNDVTTTVLGETNALLSFSLTLSPACMVVMELILSYGLAIRPSKNSLNGLREKIIYEKELLDALDIKYKRTFEGWNLKGFYNGVYEIDCTDKIKNIEDAIGLRYAFGNQNKKIMKMYEEGTLFNYLVESGISENVVYDFIQFIGNRECELKNNSHDVSMII